MGYRLNRLDGPVFMAVSKPLLTEFDIHYRLESCEPNMSNLFVVWVSFKCIGGIDLYSTVWCTAVPRKEVLGFHLKSSK